jgi:hypothetical protein
VVVLQIDVNGVLAVLSEGDPIIAARIDGEGALSVAFERVEAIAGQVHVLRSFRRASPVFANRRSALLLNDRITAVR